MHWNTINSVAELQELDEESHRQTVLIYKHSPRCGICTAALGRLERRWPEHNAPKPYFVNVLNNREVSDAVAERYLVEHESPQILLIKNGRCEFFRSHMAIDPADLT